MIMYLHLVVLKFIHITIRLLLLISDIQSTAALLLLLSVNTDLFLFIYGITPHVQLHIHSVLAMVVPQEFLAPICCHRSQVLH